LCGKNDTPPSPPGGSQVRTMASGALRLVAVNARSWRSINFAINLTPWFGRESGA